MKAPVIFDGRNLYNPAKLANLGFTYSISARRFRYRRICLTVEAFFSSP